MKTFGDGGLCFAGIRLEIGGRCPGVLGFQPGKILFHFPGSTVLRERRQKESFPANEAKMLLNANDLLFFIVLESQEVYKNKEVMS